MTLILLPVRLIIGLCLILLEYFICKILLIGYSFKEDIPLLGWRKTIIQFSLRYISRIGLFILGFYKIKQHGKPNLKEPITIVSNHISFLDILFYIYLFTPSFVAKASVISLPIIGYLSKVLQCIYTHHERSNVEDESKIIKIQHSISGVINIQKRQKLLKNKLYPSLVIFPEGTTTNGKFLIHFRKGAFIGGFPIQPVVLKYHYSCFSPTWETIPIFIHLYFLLTCFYHSIEITFLPIYYPKEDELLNPQLYAEHVQQKMAEILNVPITNHTIQLKLLYHQTILKNQLKWDQPAKFIKKPKE